MRRLTSSSSPAVSGPPSAIPYYNILWADISEDHKHLRVDFAEQTLPHRLTVRKLKFAIPPADPPHAVGEHVSAWIERLLDRSYGTAARRKRAWVLINPHAGPGGADKIWEKQTQPIFEAARMPMTVIRTSYSGEAVDLAKEVNIDDYDIAVACSGDGLPHEVFNGLGKRPDARRALSKIAVCHIPCGSGNAMSCNLYGTHRPSLAALAIVKGVPTPLDLVSVTQGNRRTLSFLSQALGMIADLDITTEHLRWMGAARFTYGFLILALQKRTYPCDIAVKAEIEQKDDIKEHYRQKVAGPTVDSTTGGTASGGGQALMAQNLAPAEPEGDDGQGLPPLKYGTIMDKLPEGWKVVSHEKLGNFYCGNASLTDHPLSSPPSTDEAFC